MTSKKQMIESSSIESGDLECIKRLRDIISSDAQSIRETLEDTQEILDQKVDQLNHLDHFLASVKEARESSVAERRVASHRTDWTKILDKAVLILRERNGDHMSFRALFQELKRQGVEINVKNPDMRLTKALTYDDRFVRPLRKGHYALREDHPNARNVGERKSRRGNVKDGDELYEGAGSG